jgi:hypothetical protein
MRASRPTAAGRAIRVGRVLFQVNDQSERVLVPGDPFDEPTGAVIRHAQPSAQ